GNRQRFRGGLKDGGVLEQQSAERLVPAVHVQSAAGVQGDHRIVGDVLAVAEPRDAAVGDDEVAGDDPAVWAAAADGEHAFNNVGRSVNHVEAARVQQETSTAGLREPRARQNHVDRAGKPVGHVNDRVGKQVELAGRGTDRVDDVIAAAQH